MTDVVQKPELGDEAKDTVTGFQGVVTSITRYLHGAPMIGIQPPVDKDGKIVEGFSFDEAQCVVVFKGKIKVAEVEKEKLTVGLGDEAFDPITQLSGTITGRADFLNGCTRFGLQPGLDKDGNHADATWFAGPRLKLTKKRNVPESKTGGPMMSLPPRD